MAVPRSSPTSSYWRSSCSCRIGRGDRSDAVNVPITRLFVLVVALFAVLIGFTSRWAVFDAKSLNDNSLNKRGVLEAARIERGVITAGDGTVLARSLKQPGGIYERTYPTGDLFPHA